jgi:hypothetical protein
MNEWKQLEYLRYLHENGCECDDTFMRDLSGECKEYYETHMRKKSEKITI